jgi:hypothetical protein
MGFLLKKNNKVSDTKFSLSKSDLGKTMSSDSTIKLYKPISEFDWKDATKSERKKTAIDAYKEFAF